MPHRRNTNLRVQPGSKKICLAWLRSRGQLGGCTATLYTLCAQGQLPHIRILNAIRIPQADLKVFVAARRAVTQRQ